MSDSEKMSLEAGGTRPNALEAVKDLLRGGYTLEEIGAALEVLRASSVAIGSEVPALVGVTGAAVEGVVEGNPLEKLDMRDPFAPGNIMAIAATVTKPVDREKLKGYLDSAEYIAHKRMLDECLSKLKPALAPHSPILFVIQQALAEIIEVEDPSGKINFINGLVRVMHLGGNAGDWIVYSGYRRFVDIGQVEADKIQAQVVDFMSQKLVIAGSSSLEKVGKNLPILILQRLGARGVLKELGLNINALPNAIDRAQYPMEFKYNGDLYIPGSILDLCRDKEAEFIKAMKDEIPILLRELLPAIDSFAPQKDQAGQPFVTGVNIYGVTQLFRQSDGSIISHLDGSGEINGLAGKRYMESRRGYEMNIRKSDLRCLFGGGTLSDGRVIKDDDFMLGSEDYSKNKRDASGPLSVKAQYVDFDIEDIPTELPLSFVVRIMGDRIEEAKSVIVVSKSCIDCLDESKEPISGYVAEYGLSDTYHEYKNLKKSGWVFGRKRKLANLQAKFDSGVKKFVSDCSYFISGQVNGSSEHPWRRIAENDLRGWMIDGGEQYLNIDNFDPDCAAKIVGQLKSKATNEVLEQTRKIVSIKKAYKGKVEPQFNEAGGLGLNEIDFNMRGVDLEAFNN